MIILWILIFALTVINAVLLTLFMSYVSQARKQSSRAAGVEADAFHHCILKIGYLETKMAESEARIKALEQELSGLRMRLRGPDAE
ncbi:MAG: hypothetical protein II922_08505 [Succinimonas sp.]|nr:hypothetical protein [Succinimonas sp.]